MTPRDSTLPHDPWYTVISVYTGLTFKYGMFRLCIQDMYCDNKSMCTFMNNDLA